ncbi:MAG: GAF domain-containing protein, partial [Candidatus Saccharibacteria bacterium]
METFLYFEEIITPLMYLTAAVIFGYLLYLTTSSKPSPNETDNDRLVRIGTIPAFVLVLAVAIMAVITDSAFKWTAVITLPASIALFAYILYQQYRSKSDELSPDTKMIQSGLSLVFGILLVFSVIGLIILPPVGWSQIMIVLPSMNMILILFGAISLVLLASVFYYVEILNRSLADMVPPNRTSSLRMKSQQNIARVGGFITWAAMVAVTITVVAGKFTPHTKGVVLVVLCAALAHNLLMLFMPWNKINSSIVFRLWGFLSMILIAVGTGVTGGFDSRFSLLFILLLVLGGSFLRFKESLYFSLAISIVYTLESVWLLPADRLGEAIPVIVFEVAVFILTTLGTAYIMSEVKKQIVMNKAFEQEAAEVEIKETPINSLIEIRESMDAMDVNTLLDNSLAAVTKFLGSETGYIMLWDDENQMLRLKSFIGHTPAKRTETLRLGQGITGEAALRKKIVTFSSQTGKYFAHPMYGSSDLFQSGISIPLVYYGSLLGCLTVYCNEDRLFTPDEQSLLFLIAERLALTLENARLYAETERSGTESQLLSDTVRDIGTMSSSREVLEYATTRITQMTGMEKCVTTVLDEKAKLLRVVAAQGDTIKNVESYTLVLEGSLGDGAIRKGKPLAVENAHKVSRSHQAPVADFNVKSFIIVPIMSGKAVYGVFYVFNSEDYKKIDQKTMNLVEAFSKMVGVFIDNLRLVENLNSQIARLTDLGEVSTLINAKLNLQETLDIIVTSATRILKKQGVVLALLDDEGYLKARSTSGVSEQFKFKFRLSSKDGLAREIFQDGKTHYTSDYRSLTNPNQLVIDENLNMIIGVPLKDNRGKIFGVLYTGDTVTYVPDADEISFITLFASQASMAISNALLYDDQDKKLRVFENLYQISSNLSRSQASMAPTFIVEKTAGLLEAEYCGYLRYDESEALLSLVLPGFNIDPAQWGIRGQMQLSVKEGLGYQIFYSWEPRIITPPMDRPVQGFDQFPYGKLRELICVRIGTPSKTVGVLFAANKKVGSFNQEDRRLMALVAHQVNVFMDNAQLLSDVKTQVQNLTDLMDVANAVQGSLRMEEILDTIVAKAWTRFKAHTCQINLLNPQKGFVEIAAYRGFTPRNLQRSDDKGVKLYTSRCPAIVNNNSFIFSWENRKEACPYFSSVNPARSYMCAPLRIGDQTQGVLHITSLKENAFTQEDLNLLASFATEASLAVQRAQLFAAIADENAKIETIIQSIDDPMAVFGPDSKVTMVNEAFYRYFAVAQKDV